MIHPAPQLTRFNAFRRPCSGFLASFGSVSVPAKRLKTKVSRWFRFLFGSTSVPPYRTEIKAVSAIHAVIPLEPRLSSSPYVRKRACAAACSLGSI